MNEQNHEKSWPDMAMENGTHFSINRVENNFLNTQQIQSFFGFQQTTFKACQLEK